MLTRLIIWLAAMAVLGGCAAGSTLQQPPADLEHPKPAIEGGGGY